MNESFELRESVTKVEPGEPRQTEPGHFSPQSGLSTQHVGGGRTRGGERRKGGGKTEISKPGNRSRTPSVKSGAEFTTHLKNMEKLLRYFKQGGDTQSSFSKDPYVHSAVWRKPGSL